jgi:hypothetical protein
MQNKYTTCTLIHAIMMLIALTTLGCQNTSEQALQCASTADCYSGEMCRHERCVLRSQEVSEAQTSEGSTSTPARIDDGSTPLPPGPEQRPPQQNTSPDMTGLDVANSPTDMGAPARDWTDQSPSYGIGEPGEDMLDDMGIVPPCEGVEPMVGELVINELLMNVPPGEQGDANADGTRDAYDDEFVEIVNISELTLSLEDVELMVNDNVRLAFGALCLRPGQTVVVFSGPRDRVMTWRDDVVFMAPDSKLGLSNTSGKVELWDAFDRVIFSFVYDGAQKTSYVLWPELTGDVFVPHESISMDLFSPGRCANGLALFTGCTQDDASEDGE